MLKANQIVCITSTFKIDVINQEIPNLAPYQMLSQPCFPLLLNNSSFFEAHNLRKSYSGEACLRYFCIAVIQLLRVLSFDKPCLN